MVRTFITMIGAVALTLSATACASTGAVPKPFPMAPSSSPARSRPRAPDTSDPSPVVTKSEAYALVGTALQLRGVPYRDGGTDRNGFDCSGFTQYVFAQYGVSLPRAVRDQFKAGSAVNAEDLTVGDLLFFSTTESGVSHVGIAVGGDQFVHAPSSTGVVRVERLSARYWSDRFLGARRITQP